jgi:hypothetical protein
VETIVGSFVGRAVVIGVEANVGKLDNGTVVDGGCDFDGLLVVGERDGLLVVPFEVGTVVGNNVCIDGIFVGRGENELLVGNIEVVVDVGLRDAIGN